jgi:tetratricopeptide (TPR) repeat protein
MRLSLILAVGLLGLFGCGVLLAQTNPQSAQARGSIEVHLRLVDGSTFSAPARIRILSAEGPEVGENSVDTSGSTKVEQLPPATYIVEASAPGFVTVRETVELETTWSAVTVFLTMKPQDSSNAVPAAPAIPILAPHARKELNKGMEAFRRKDMVNARKHFEKALAMAPGHPDVQFLMGALEWEENNISAAQTHLETAIQLFPNHVRALELLAELYCREGHPQQAVPLLERAVPLEDGSWKAHWKLGSAYLQAGEPAKAQHEAERAVALGKEDAGIAQVLEAGALADLGKPDAAETVLKAFIQDQPNDPAVAPARVFLADLAQEEERKKGVPMAAPSPAELPPATMIANAAPVILPSTNSVWNRPGIDEFVPKVAPNVACDLPQVLRRTGKRVEQLTNSLERFTATERVEHSPVDKKGNLRSPETRAFDYVVSVSHKSDGLIQLAEYRDGTTDPALFPASIATDGLPAMALVFHPRMSSDFHFVCEGLGQASGRPAWQVHFQQKANRPSRIRAYIISGNFHAVPLKGRAWIDASTYQVVRLESELVKPMPEIGLRREDLSIDYAPVQFRSRDVQLWLPSRAELLVDLGNKPFYRTHTFSKFELFSVGTGQQLGAPKESYSFTNISDQDIDGELTVTPVGGRSLSPISIAFTIPSRRSIYKTVGHGKDLDISPDSIASARFVYAGAPGVIQAEAKLTSASTLEIVPESRSPATPHE